MATTTKREAEKPRTINDMPQYSKLTAEIGKLKARQVEIGKELVGLPSTAGPKPDPTEILLGDDSDAHRRAWRLKYKNDSLDKDIRVLQLRLQQAQGEESSKLYRETYQREHYEKLVGIVDAAERLQHLIVAEEEFARKLVKAGITIPPWRPKGCFRACPRLIDMVKNIKFARVREHLQTLKQSLKGR